MTLVLALVLFVLLVVIHEYGHFLVAKRNGVEVEEFGIGFPPKIVGKTFGKGIFRSYYTLNLLPLGGFVRLKGESDSATGKGTFGAASFWVKTKIILAGVIMNFITAIVLFAVLAFTGMPQLVDEQYTVGSETVSAQEVVAINVVDGSPAGEAGVSNGDPIRQFAGQSIVSADQLFQLSEENKGQDVEVSFGPDNDVQNLTVRLNDDNSEQGYFGVEPADLTSKKYGAIDSVRVGVGTTLQFAKLTYQGLGDMIVNLFQADFEEVGEQVSGPVGIVVIITNIAIFGVSYVLYFMAIISLTLAVMNSLPIPALDGGRLFVSGLFKLIKKPLSESLEQKIHGTGFAALLVLIGLITIVDVRRFF